MIRKPSVFIVHSEGSRHAIDLLEHLRGNYHDFDFLSLGAELRYGESVPIELERVASTGDAAIILASEDDVGRRKSEKRLRSRTRQNIWLELGWFWARVGRGRSLIINHKDIEIPSDLHGVYTVEYLESPLEQDGKISKFLNNVLNDASKTTPEVVFSSIDPDARIQQFQSVVNSAVNVLAISGIGMTAMRHTFQQILATKTLVNQNFSLNLLTLDGDFAEKSKEFTDNIYRDSIATDINIFSTEVLSIFSKSDQLRKNISFRKYKGIMPFVITAADPNELGGQMMVEILPPLGRLCHPHERARFLLQRRTNHGVFRKIWESFEDMWKNSTVVI